MTSNNGKEIPVNFVDEKEKQENTENKQNAEPEMKVKNKSKEKKSATAKLEKELEKLRSEYDALNDQFLRLRAEFVNYRKRVERENLELAAYLKAEIFKKILPVVDDFEQMFRNSGDGSNEASILEGARMIYNKLMNTLQTEGLEKIEALNQEFDPQIHEAMMMQPVDDPEKHNKVITVFQDGFKIKDRLIRPTKAIVGNFNQESQESEDKNLN